MKTEKKSTSLLHRSYSEKEIALFAAIDQLTNQGRLIHDLKVSDIAAVAGIGKGTVYEYFKSKEDIIRHAVRYHIGEELQHINRLIQDMTSFRQALEDGLELVCDMAKNRLPSLWAMLYSVGNQDPKTMDPVDIEYCQTILQEINRCIERLMDQGIREGMISGETTPAYRKFVLNGVVTAYVQSVHDPAVCLGLTDPDTDLRAVPLQFAWDVLVRAL